VKLFILRIKMRNGITRIFPPVVAFCGTFMLQGCAAGTDDGTSDAVTDPAADGIADAQPEADEPDGSDPAPETADGTSEDGTSEDGTSEDGTSEDGAWDWVVDEAPDTPADLVDSLDPPYDPDVIPDPDEEEIISDTFDPEPDAVDAPDTVDSVVDEVAEEAPPGEVWMEISYQYRSAGESPSTADWSYSSTPGWTEAQWAPSSSSWPYIHVPDGGSLVSDPIGGTVLELGCYDRFRLFFGLEELSHVGYATVTLEGRSRATSAGVDIEIWNPGASSSIVSYASMSQDWTADIVTVDFTAEAGNGFQAVEIAPVARSCSLALRRVRLTLYTIY
jgi:hypothetical protein